MKKVLKAISTIVLIALVIYIGFSVYISVSVSNLINSINNGESYDTSRIANDELDVADLITVRNGYATEGVAREKLELSFPISVHYFTGGKIYYKYTYEALDSNNEVLAGGTDIPVTLTFEMQGLNWVITDCYEEP